MVEESDLREAPDWPLELSEPVSRLGTPSEVFRIPRAHVVRRAVSGISLMTGGGIANYLYWVVFNGPLADMHLLFLLLFGPILSGAGLIYAAWRDRGLWVLVFPMGLLRWQRGEVLTFPWEEVDHLAFHRVVECDQPRRETDADGEIIKSWLPIAKMGSRTLGAHLSLRRQDGAEAIFPSSIANFRRLCQVVQEETFITKWPETWERFNQGDRLKFGDVSLCLDGISGDGDLLPWSELADAVIQNGKLMIRARRVRKPWLEVPLQSVPNPHLFAALLIRGGKSGRV